MNITVYSALLPLAAGLYYFKRLPLPFRILLLYVAMGVLMEEALAWMARERGNNMPLMHLYSVLEFTLLCLMYYFFFSDQRVRRLLLALIPLFALGAALFALEYGIDTYNTIPSAMVNLVMMGCSVYHLVTLYQEQPIGTPAAGAAYQVTSGVLIYFSGTIFLFASGNLLASHKPVLPVQLWYLHFALRIVLNIFIAAGFRKLRVV